MRRIFGRTPPSSPSPLASGVDKDAHGCPACPHGPLAQREFDEDGASTLLPVHQTDIEGHAFEHMAMTTEISAGFDEDVDFDLD